MIDKSFQPFPFFHLGIISNVPVTCSHKRHIHLLWRDHPWLAGCLKRGLIGYLVSVTEWAWWKKYHGQWFRHKALRTRAIKLVKSNEILVIVDFATWNLSKTDSIKSPQTREGNILPWNWFHASSWFKTRPNMNLQSSWIWAWSLEVILDDHVNSRLPDWSLSPVWTKQRLEECLGKIWWNNSLKKHWTWEGPELNNDIRTDGNLLSSSKYHHHILSNLLF